ncbi:MAG: hypothetical protein JWM34_5232 [Ilumatobacteraceae bacterium]|nr:hypothetical protein [Ilumatobacteraceae bacterium]
MSDWSTIASVGTAAGTLVLAFATFASVRSSNRSARATERALLAGLRPLIVASRLEDSPEKVGFMDAHWMRVEGGHGLIEVTDDAIYLAIAIRNVGSGIAVLDRWDLHVDRPPSTNTPDVDTFRRLTRDIYVAFGDHGFWQGALRDPSEPMFAEVRDAVADGRNVTIDLLYGDHEGGQRTISRFSLIVTPSGSRIAAVSRHWNLDRPDPR